MIKINEIISILTAKGLKITPQRIAVYKSLMKFAPHPSKDDVIFDVHEEYPNISIATIYNVLDTFVKNKIISKLKTDKDIIQYEMNENNHHHHVYCSETGKINDYMNEDVDNFLKEYFKKNPISNFDITDIKLQINGHYIK